MALQTDPPSNFSYHTLNQPDNASWIWDCEKAHLLWANAQGAAFWGELDLHKLCQLSFDNAMPAIAQLRDLADHPDIDHGLYADLVFWTKKGAQTAHCYIRNYHSEDVPKESLIALNLQDIVKGLLITLSDANMSDTNRQAHAPRQNVSSFGTHLQKQPSRTLPDATPPTTKPQDTKPQEAHRRKFAPTTMQPEEKASLQASLSPTGDGQKPRSKKTASPPSSADQDALKAIAQQINRKSSAPGPQEIEPEPEPALSPEVHSPPSTTHSTHSASEAIVEATQTLLEDFPWPVCLLQAQKQDIASKKLAALPRWLANSSFLKAFHFSSMKSLKMAGGPAALFPEEMAKLHAEAPYLKDTDHARTWSNPKSKLVNCTALNKEGKEFSLFFAVHMIEIGQQDYFHVSLIPHETKPLARPAPDANLAPQVAEQGAEQQTELQTEPQDAMVFNPALLHKIVELTTYGLITLDKNAALISFSPRAQQILQKIAPKDAALRSNIDTAGRKITDFLDEESHHALAQALENIATHNYSASRQESVDVTPYNKSDLLALSFTLGGLPGAQQAKFWLVLTPAREARRDAQQKPQITELKKSTITDEEISFIAKASHEIRTPLNAIHGFAELMREQQFGPIENNKYRGYINDIYQSAAHALDLVNDLLDLSKVTAGALAEQAEPINLNRLVEHCSQMMQVEAHKARIVMRLSLDNALPDILGRERAVKQIIFNLLSNALRATQQGGQVILSTQIHDEHLVKFTLSDTGIGMTPEDVERALRPFQQVEDMPGTYPRGTGLGLPLTKALAEALNADFSLQSTKGEGTIATLLFPRA